MPIFYSLYIGIDYIIIKWSVLTFIYFRGSVEASVLADIAS